MGVTTTARLPMTSYERKMSGRKSVREREKEERDEFQRNYIKYLTELPYDKVKGTDIENDWHDVQSSLHGSVRADTRSTIQRTADELYESGPVGATLAAVADVLPGLPGVDIIDPPAQLSDKGMQSARNILGIVGGGGVMSKTPQAVGRVATNIREPWSYSGTIEKVKKGIAGPDLSYGQTDFRDKIKTVIGSIIRDEPLYGVRDPRMFGQAPGGPYSLAAADAREYLYRTMFGLKPRAGKNIFKKNKDGTLSFNPKDKRARILINVIADADAQSYLGNIRLDATHHAVMGGYHRSFKRKKGIPFIEYEDIWDFKMNPSDWRGLLVGLKELKNAVILRKSGLNDPRHLKDVGKRTLFELGEAGLRTLVHSITKPPHVKGHLLPLGKPKTQLEKRLSPRGHIFRYPDAGY